MFHEMKLGRQEYHIQNNPLKKLLPKDSLAEIIYEITTEKWAHLNGAVVPVNVGSYVQIHGSYRWRIFGTTIGHRI